MEELNTVNDVQGEVVDARNISGAEISEAAGGGVSAEPEACADVANRQKAPKQSEKANSDYAKMRREKEEQMRREVQDAQNGRQLLASSLERLGYTGAPHEIARQLGVLEEDAQVSPMLMPPAQDEGEKTRLGLLREIASKQFFERDLSAINRAFPTDKVGSVTALGQEFLRLRANGVDAVTAYGAVRCAKEAARPQIPPAVGAVNRTSNKSKDYYTPAEAERLSSAQLEDPKIWEAVRRSMERWGR